MLNVCSKYRAQRTEMRMHFEIEEKFNYLPFQYSLDVEKFSAVNSVVNLQFIFGNILLLNDDHIRVNSSSTSCTMYVMCAT